MKIPLHSTQSYARGIRNTLTPQLDSLLSEFFKLSEVRFERAQSAHAAVIVYVQSYSSWALLILGTMNLMLSAVLCAALNIKFIPRLSSASYSNGRAG